MCKKGFVSLPFLVLFSICLSLCAVLTTQIKKEIMILDNMKHVNQQIQKEWLILEKVKCMIQCNDQISETVWIDEDQVDIECTDGLCLVTASFFQMMIEIDTETKQFLRVSVQ